MSRDPFVFSLEPERIAVGADRDELLARVARARAALEEALVDRANRSDFLEESVQRTRRFHDEETAGARYDAGEWTARTEYLAALEESERDARGSLAEAERQVRTTGKVLANLEARLTEAELALRSLEDECGRQRRAWQRDVERRAEARRDDEALLRWNHEQCEARRHE